MVRLVLDELLADIRDSGKGPDIIAFFDFDRTLIHGYSASDFVMEQLRGGEISPRDLAAQAVAAAKFSTGRMNFSAFIGETAKMMRGQAEFVFEEFGERVYRKKVAGKIYPEARALLAAHKEMGHTIAVVSSATIYQIEPAARELGIEYILCTDLEVEDGVFTGKIISPSCFGDGKRMAGEDFAAEIGGELSRSFFYTDSDDDLPLLEAVGRPRVLNPNTRLARLARQNAWPVCKFDSRGRPSIGRIARMGSVYGMLPTSIALTAPLTALTGNKRMALNAAFSIWSDFAAALAGIKFDIDGEEHVWSQRPAVFIFNHQSAVDALVMCRLLQRDFTGVGKKEISRFPIVGAVFQYADVVFVDRRDGTRARETLRPVVDALNKDGLSICIAPEGTRSRGQALGRFKKGAFHIAMQAKVPVVPVVIHNASDALPKGAHIARPANIKVTVLPPVSTENWTVSTLNKNVTAIRRMYLKELGQDGFGV